MAEDGSNTTTVLPTIRPPTPTSQTSPTNVAESSCYSRIYADIRRGRSLPPDSEGNEFYDIGELAETVPQGFPSLAAEKAQWPTFRTFQTFDYLTWRLMEKYGSALHYLENKLHKLDDMEADSMKGLQRSRVPFDKKMFADCSFGSSDPSDTSEMTELSTEQEEIVSCRERIFAQIERIMKKYRRHAMWIEQASAFPRVHRATYKQLFTAAQELDGLSGEAIEHYRAATDRVHVGMSQLEYQLEILWQSTAQWIKDLLRRFIGRPAQPDDGGSIIYSYVSERKVKLLYGIPAVLFIIWLVIMPIAIMYLVQPGKPVCFGILLIFGIVFAALLFYIESIGHAIVGTVAYIALLAAVMASLT